MTTPTLSAPAVALWNNGKLMGRLTPLSKDEAAGRLTRSTFSYHLSRFYKIDLAEAKAVASGLNLVAGTPDTNPTLAELVKAGLTLTDRELGDEGFQLLSHEDGKFQYVIIYGKTPRSLKHGIQELVFYHMPATASTVGVEWPLNVVMKPELAYRGIYMLPCWSPNDSIESWQRVLRFNSELTINRNWFWLAGFPIASNPGQYAGTPLAEARNVQGLIDLVNEEDMKFYVGGGWLTWHHEQAVGKDIQKGIDYYLNYLRSFKNIRGFYFEPTGEPENDGRSAESETWREESDGLHQLIETVMKQQPDLEIALAIGKFNNNKYLQRMATFDPKRVFWWWCWGDPVADKAYERFPQVLNWQTMNRGEISMTHSGRRPPGPAHRKLAGSVTSFDPGMGFGNPWNGRASKINWKEMIPDPLQRNFDPHTLPYFFLQYYFRERSWNLELDEDQLTARLQRRLFDADAPPTAASRYVDLSRMTLQAYDGGSSTLEELQPIRAFLDSVQGRKMTPRMQDTLARMEEALLHLAQVAKSAK
jgi:hypothetical protein